jgi:hypothetical protein
MSAAPSAEREPASRAWSMRGRVLLVLVLAVAAWLRFWGLSFGLDLQDPERAVFNSNVDESGMVQAVLHGALAGSPDPGEFLNRGPAAFYIFGALDALTLLPRALQHPQGWSGVRAELAANPSWLHLTHRTWSALASIATVLVLACVVRRHLGEAAALVAAAMLAVLYIHVRESHFGGVDALFGLAFALTLGRLVRLAREGTASAHAWAGVLAGATTAVKYFGAVLVAHLLVCHLLARAAARREGRTPPPWSRGALALACMVAGFLLLAPNMFLAPDAAFARTSQDFGNYGIEPSLGALASHAAWHARTSLAAGAGLPLALLCLAGLLLGSSTPGRGPLRLFAILALLTLPCPMTIRLQAPRHALPFVISLVPVAAGAAVWFGRRAAERLPRGSLAAHPLAGAAAVALLVAPSAARSMAFDARIGRQDTRAEMLERLRALGVAQDQILGFGTYGLPRSHAPGASPYVDAYRTARWAPELIPDAARQPPRYVLVEENALDLSEWTGLDLQSFLAQHYREALRLDPRDPAELLPYATLADGAHPGNLFSFQRPSALTRPGPVLVLYERTD